MPVTEQTCVSSIPNNPKAAKMAAETYHPHDPLTPQEIRLASSVFKTEMLRRGVRSIKSCYVDLLERES